MLNLQFANTKNILSNIEKDWTVESSNQFTYNLIDIIVKIITVTAIGYRIELSFIF